MRVSKSKIRNWTARKLRPESVTIKPKALNMSLDDSTPTYFVDNNPFLTQCFTAFSAIFPGGERFMIDSVRLFRDDIKEHKALNKDCGGFIGQEAHHANEHALINDFMAARGFPVKKLESLVDSLMPYFQKLPEKDQMALAGAAEHLTALFGDLVLSNPEIIELVHPSIRPVWVWHAIEEIEHKAVTYDVFDATDGSYVRRVYGYGLALGLIVGLSVYGTALFVVEDRKNFSVQQTAKGLWWMFGAGKQVGYLRKSLPFLLEYFKPSFHPWDHDNSDLIAKWRPELDKMFRDVQESQQAA